MGRAPSGHDHVLELGINDLTDSSQMMVIVLGDKHQVIDKADGLLKAGMQPRTRKDLRL